MSKFANDKSNRKQIRRSGSVKGLKGMIRKPGKPVSLEEMRAAIVRGATKSKPSAPKSKSL